MQQAAFMFVERNWERDRAVMTRMMNHYADLDVNMQVSVTTCQVTVGQISSVDNKAGSNYTK